MGELTMEDMPLPALFEQARKIHVAATESGGGRDAGFWRSAMRMISKLGLFSANETKEDISTTNLKYLMVPYYLGELTEKVAQDDRISILKASQAKLKEFISICEAMELVPKEELEASAVGGPNSHVDRRALKIARFKRQRAAESKLLEIKEASALSTPIEAGEKMLLDDDGEEEREAWFTTISLAVSKTFDLLEMLKKEEEMLVAFKERQSKKFLTDRAKRAEAWHRDAATRVQYSRPAEPITCATFAQDVLEGRARVSEMHEHKHQPLIFGPASLIGGNPTSERERMAAQVFQPSHRMPTMSIEEAGLKEMEIMNTWQERNEPMKPGPPPEGEEEDDDAAQDRARAWDDWKDDNPRGAGNKKLTPCG
ncbi:PP2A regulatory subunit TAP46-like [Pyrus ussuriensis x Pyrus communis]|uniref:PP2A regulatory subunit TAP46-like n=1 Tax=Pyrus ussuriensis x Pyrus communis TaxID=2448454 RepID=A0A5N5F1F3_9ROSA|nr:PP2A regulatory subunit TAP46-like [Pyrus ussuriensis x Pyrus communis]